MLFRFLRARRASISVIAAIALPIVVGTVALGSDFGRALMAQAENQRIADAAAVAGADAYLATSSTDRMTQAAQRIGTLNGLSASAVSVSLGNSPTSDGNQAVLATVTTTQSFLLAPIVGAASSRSVSAAGYAEFSASEPACVLALNANSGGISLSGGTRITAAACAVNSNYSVSVPCGTYITTPLLRYGESSGLSVGCGGVAAPSGQTLKEVNASTSDWLAGNTTIAALTSRITTVAAMTSPAAPSASGGSSYAFAYAALTFPGTTCTDAYSSGTHTVTCTGNGPFNFANFTLNGGVTVKFNVSGSASATYNFSGYIKNTGTLLQFGPGTYNIAGGLYTGGGTATSFGAGTFNIGKYTSSCSGDTYSICQTGSSLTFAGPSNFTLSNGIYVGGGETVVMGSGSTANTYNIGASTNGSAIYMGGGAILTMNDALGSTFKTVGLVNAAGGGGSCLTIPAATNHDLNGALSSAGGTIAGAGTYTVNGYIALGNSGGGDVTCGGVSVGFNAPSSTFVISGSSSVASGNCVGVAFCIGAGFGHVTVVAPSSGTYVNLAVIGPAASSNTKGVLLTEGASSTSVSGVFYFPHGAISLSGGASLGNGSGQCLELIGDHITLSGGTAIATTCNGYAGSVSTTSSGSSSSALNGVRVVK